MNWLTGASRTLTGVLATIWVATTLTAPARADDDAAEALIKQGNDLRRRGLNEQALPLLQRAYDTSKTARTAAQLGLAEQATERFVEAEGHIVEALSSRSDPWIVKNRTVLENGLVTIRGSLAHVTVNGTPDGADVLVNERLVGRLPHSPTVAVNPGRVEVRIQKSDFEPMRQVLDVHKGAYEKVEVALRAFPSPIATNAAAAPTLIDHASAGSPPERTSQQTWTRPLGIVAGAVGLAAIGTGIALKVVSSRKHDDIQADAQAGRPYDPGNGNWSSLGRAGTTSLIAGGVVFVGGTVLFFLPSKDRDATAVSFEPTTNLGAQLSMRGRF